MILAAAMTLAAAGALSAQPNLAPKPVDKSHEIVNEVSIDQKLDAQVPLNLQFLDESGRTVRLSDYVSDKPVVLVLAYYRCPMLCTEVLNGVVKAFRLLKFDVGNEFNVLTVSIDPEETPELSAEKKASYIKNYGRAGAEKGWHFLVGEKGAIDSLANAVGFRYVYDPQSGQYAHAGGIMLLTPKGRVARYFYGIDFMPDDLRLGLVEASENKIGSPVDALLLLCYHYDPITGKYGLVIMRVLQGAAILTIAAFGSFWFWTIRRDRRKKLAVVGG